MAYTCLLIGLGQIGMGYDLDLADQSAVYTHARALLMHPEFQLLGAVDMSSERQHIFHHKYNLPAFATVEEAIECLQPDIVVIATSSESHPDILEKVLKVDNLKAIICEKPLAYALEDARRMVALCESANVRLYVNYIRRSDPGAIEVQHRIERGTLRGPIKGVAWYSKGIINNGSHFINLLEFWLGQVQEAQLIKAGRLWDNHDPEPDVEIHFERGSVLFCAAWEESFSHYTIELLSPAGRLRYERGGELIEWQAVIADPAFSGYQILEHEKEQIFSGMHKYQWHLYEQIYQSLTGMPSSACTGKQALMTLEAIEQIIKQRQV